MSITDTLVVAVAWMLPGLARQRYREDWLANLIGARDLELSQWSIVGGAVMAAISIDRTDPSVTSITKANLVANRMRWAAALLGSTAVLGFGLFLRGGYEMRYVPVLLGRTRQYDQLEIGRVTRARRGIRPRGVVSRSLRRKAHRSTFNSNLNALGYGM